MLSLTRSGRGTQERRARRNPCEQAAALAACLSSRERQAVLRDYAERRTRAPEFEAAPVLDAALYLVIFCGLPVSIPQIGRFVREQTWERFRSGIG